MSKGFSTPVLVAAIFLAGTASFICGVLAVNTEPLSLDPCQSESSRDCIWVADLQGNGEGSTFIDYSGNTYYLEAK